MSTTESRIWRVLEDGPCDADWNMALDRAIQLEHSRGVAPPTLRLYRWSRPTVTLGRFQRLDGVDLDECAERDVDVVRRFTGGRGVLHDDELTYSVVAGERDGIPRGVAASYRLLCGVLARAYARLGVAAELTERHRGQRDSAACYLHATKADLSVGAAKLSGSAQIWHAGTCLQHGSFVRSRDLHREAAVFRLGDRGAAALGDSTVTLGDICVPMPDFVEMSEAVIGALAEELGVRLEPGCPSESELTTARELLGEVQVSGSG